MSFHAFFSKCCPFTCIFNQLHFPVLRPSPSLPTHFPSRFRFLLNQSSILPFLPLVILIFSSLSAMSLSPSLPTSAPSKFLCPIHLPIPLLISLLYFSLSGSDFPSTHLLLFLPLSLQSFSLLSTSFSLSSSSNPFPFLVPFLVPLTSPPLLFPSYLCIPFSVPLLCASICPLPLCISVLLKATSCGGLSTPRRVVVVYIFVLLEVIVSLIIVNQPDI